MELTRDFSKVNLRIAADLTGPKLGEVAELVRSTLSKQYGIVPPNLNTALDQTGSSMTIMAVDKSTGLNVQIVVSDLGQQAVPAQLPPAMPPTNATQPAGVPTA
jgi:hypothetical protein